MTTYFLAPSPKWSARNLVGDAAIGAYLFTYQNGTRLPKATFTDSTGTVPNPNPLQLDSAGEYVIYWSDSEFYSIALYDADGGLIYTADNYPVTGTGGGGNDITIDEVPQNLVRNPQFFSWNQSNNLIQTTSVIYRRLGLSEFICDDWVFSRSNTNATISIERVNLTPGEEIIPANPVYAIHYTCTDVGAGGETAKYFSQFYQSVKTLQDTQVSCGFWAYSDYPITITAYIEQYFGSGGAPSPDTGTTFATITLTPGVWVQVTGTITLPSILGKNIGTNGDDGLFLIIVLPVNTICNFYYTNVQIHPSNTLPPFPVQTPDDQLKAINARVLDPAFKTGDAKITLRTTADTGWILMNDGTIGNFFSNANYRGNDLLNLYVLLWDSVSNDWAPIFHPDGTPATRGVSAWNDWNADKQLQLTRQLGRTIVFAGAGAGLTPRILGHYGGEEEHVITKPELPDERLEITLAQPQGLLTALRTDGSGDYAVGVGPSANNNLLNVDLYTERMGSGAGHNNMQPFAVWNVMIKK